MKSIKKEKGIGRTAEVEKERERKRKRRNKDKENIWPV